MRDEGGSALTGLVLIALAVWLAFGGGWDIVSGWVGGDRFEDQREVLAELMRDRRIGTSNDVWLVKGNFGAPDRVALFFGYLDDWDACHEFLTAHSYQFPADRYSCEYANAE